MCLAFNSRIIFVFFILPLILFGRIEESREKLLTIQKNIEKYEKELEIIGRKRDSIVEKIAAIGKQQEIRKKRLRQTDDEIKKISKKIEVTTSVINSLTQEIASKKSGVSFLINEMFFLSNKKTFIQKDQDENEINIEILLNELCTSISIKEEEKKKEIAKRNGLKTVLDKTQEEKRIIISDIKRGEEEEAIQKRNLASIKSNEEALKRKIAKLKADQKKLEVLIRQLEEKRRVQKPKEETPSKLKGSFIWPVKSRNIVRDFGRYVHPETGTIMINKGIDISAPLGADVFAIGNGEVVYADWFMGYGRLIMIDHSEGIYSLYAHLDNILVTQGQKVLRETKIGSVGKSGDIDEPTLHFEIRVSANPVNPLDWLP